MKKPNLITLASIAANLILAGSLVHVYQTTSDTAFKTWVEQNILSTFTLVLSGSLIAGAALGYFLLRRKGPSISRLQRIGPQKQSSTFPRPGGISSQARSVPMGPPPGPTSKHTAYAVPPLAKTPSQSPKQSTSWSAAPRQWSPATFSAQRQEPLETPNSPEPPYPARQIEPQPTTGPPRILPADRQPTIQGGQPEFTKPVPPPSAPIREPVQSDQPPRWGPQPGSQSQPPRMPAPYQGPTSESQPVPPYLRQPIGPPTERPQGFAPPNEVPRRSDLGVGNSWTGPNSPPEYSSPQKWLPPSASPLTRTPAPISPSFGQGPQNETRPSFAGPQGAPRPLGYPGPPRQGPIGEVPRYIERRPSMPTNQQGPGIGTRPIPPGPRPSQPESMTSPSSPRPDTNRQSPSPSSRPEQPNRSQDIPPTASPTAGEMDWDTALDAILKTLRKDKVEEKP